MSKRRRGQWRRTKYDDLHLAIACDHTGLSQSDVIRFAVREFNYRHGYALTEAVKLLLYTEKLLVACRIAGVPGIEKSLKSAETVIARHRELMFDFVDYPKDIQRELLEEEKAARRVRVESIRKARKRP
jgi:hypothetical protein